jgi:short-subunit dehydrogenase
MYSAVVTGASSGIGKAIADYLEKEYKVYRVSKSDGIDLSNIKSLEKLEFIKDKNIKILVNAAGIGIFKPHEEIKVEEITNLININLTAPIILSKLLLRTLKKNQGYIFNITSIEALRFSKFSALYTATKAGLRSFSMSLFEEVRKDVKIISINPDITKTNFFDKLSFSYDNDELAYIEPECIVDVIKHCLNTREGTIIEDITIRPKLIKIKKIKRK